VAIFPLVKGFAGDSSGLPLISGMFQTRNPDAISDKIVQEARNVNLNEDGYTKRGGTALLDAITGDPRILALQDFTLNDGTQFIMRATSNSIYKNNTTTVKTGLSTSRGGFTSFQPDFASDNRSYFYNGQDRPQVWDGSAGATIDMCSEGLTVPTACIAALGAAGSVTAGTHSYQITFVNAAGETTGGATSNVITAAPSRVNLTSIPLGPTGVTSRKIYRTVAGDAGAYKLVDTLSDNTTTTYEDNTADGALGADAPASNTADAISVDWTGVNFPKQLIVHGKGNASTLWAIGCPQTPYRVYRAQTGTDKFFGGVTFDIHTGDGFGIIGAVEYGERLVLFSKQFAYLIVDDDTDTDNWTYIKAQWRGGAAHEDLIVELDNDIHIMTDDGDIYSVGAVQDFGDYKKASVLRPARMHRWIKDNVLLDNLNDFHATYDPVERCVKWFVVRQGETEVDTAMVYYIDKPPDAAWVLHDNRTSNSGYSASASTLVKSGSDYLIYTGDYDGNTWSLENSTKSDNAQAYYAGLTTHELSLGLVRETKEWFKGWVISDDTNVALVVNVWVDGVQVVTAGSVTLAANNNAFDIRTVGQRVKIELQNSTAGDDFFIRQLLIDFINKGRKSS
jgi:hypothetical protein